MGKGTAEPLTEEEAAALGLKNFKVQNIFLFTACLACVPSSLATLQILKRNASHYYLPHPECAANIRGQDSKGLFGYTHAERKPSHREDVPPRPHELCGSHEGASALPSRPYIYVTSRNIVNESFK